MKKILMLSFIIFLLFFTPANIISPQDENNNEITFDEIMDDIRDLMEQISELNENDPKNYEELYKLSLQLVRKLFLSLNYSFSIQDYLELKTLLTEKQELLSQLTQEIEETVTTINGIIDFVLEIVERLEGTVDNIEEILSTVGSLADLVKFYEELVDNYFNEKEELLNQKEEKLNEQEEKLKKWEEILIIREKLLNQKQIYISVTPVWDFHNGEFDLDLGFGYQFWKNLGLGIEIGLTPFQNNFIISSVGLSCIIYLP